MKSPLVSMLIPVSNCPHLTSYVFYNHLIPLLHKTFVENRNPTVSLDLRGVDTISPQALVGLLIVGEKLRKHYKEPVELIIEWKAELLRSLSEMGFFNLNRENDLFSYDPRFAGGFESALHPDDFHLLVRFEAPPETIVQQVVFIADEHEKTFARFFESESDLFDFKRIFIELVKNAAIHGESPCYVVIFGNRRTGLVCAVYDIGIGFLKSQIKEPNELRLFPLNEMLLNDGKQNLRAILEAVYRRVGTSTYGISSLTDTVTSKCGIVRIHSENTQVIFTKSTFRYFVGSNKRNRKFISELMQYLETRKALVSGARKSPLRSWDAKLSGVHVEIEIPPLTYRRGGYQL